MKNDSVNATIENDRAEHTMADKHHLAERESVAEGVHVDAPSHPPKSFSMLSAAGLGYSITNSPTAIFLVIGANTPFGGSPLFFYGYLGMFLVGLAAACSLGELASAMPHPGGQYYWVSQLAPEKWRRFLAYMTAILSWASVICVGASSLLAASNLFFEMYSFYHPDFVYHPWMGFLFYQVANLFTAMGNLSEKALPKMGFIFMMYSIAFSFVIFVGLLAPDVPKVSAHEFFTNYWNASGWSDGVAFFIGISGCNWAFSCLDAVTHLAEELPNPERNLPKALFVTVGVGFGAGMAVIIAVFIAATDLRSVTTILEVIYSVYGNYNATIGFGVLVFLSPLTAMVGIQTWQARIAWSLARDKGFPFHKHLSKVAPKPFQTPLWAHAWSLLWTALCGFVYLGSQAAFNSFVAGGILLQYITYCIPLIFMLWKGRSNFANGPFWHPTWGLISNIVVLSWSAICLIFYSFPYYLPVVADQMNYVSCVIVFIILYALTYWGFIGYKHFDFTEHSITQRF
ncbi:hypothetical protein MRS44_009656 [Fusarium solani]|uniref:uncharacterized protein n=1 Tax=Fusarium solani TaxID=169388 RepID=UPI0032C44916|nr:hypothetical protein MRS44_009656 [Fusarium solani]